MVSEHFTCIVRSLYALTYYQIVCQFCAAASAEGRAALAAPSSARPPEREGLRHAARVLLAALAGSDLFTEDGPPPSTSSEEPPDIAHMEKRVCCLLQP